MNKKYKADEILNLHDRPITNFKEDYFDIKTHVVDKIIKLVSDKDIAPLSVAMTGEWGSGKTSAINLLVNELNLDNKNIVIFFEPLLEGKTSLAEIIELFYLKLYQAIDDNKIKKIIIKSFKGLATLLRAKLTGNIALPDNSASATLEYDLGKNIDDLFKLFDDNSPKPFSLQTQELNTALKKNSYKLYIILDEIDRLPATHIITMLMFARTIETFDNLICIIGMDYKQVINKIIKENALGMADYETTKSYLDKLFQANFHIDINTDKKIKFAVDLLKKIDIDNIFFSIFESDDYDDRVKFEKIIFHLGTPRRIKKWIISIKINYPIIRHCPNKLDFIAFLSSATVHHILSENISKHTLPLLCRRYFKELYLKDMYDLNFTNKDGSKDSDEEIILSSAGINVNSKNETIQKFLKLVTEHPIHESLSKNFTTSFLINTPVHFLILYIEGYADDKKVSAYNDFFEKDIDKALKILVTDDDSKATLAFDLAETIRKNSLQVNGSPSLNLLNELWLQKIDESSNFGNPYEPIILASLKNISLDDIVTNCYLSLSEAYLHRILLAHGIKNEDGVYDLNKFTAPSDIDINKYHLKLKLNTKKKLEAVLTKWISKTEESFSNNRSEWVKQNLLVSVFYRYIQWSHALNQDNRDKLASFITNLLNNEKTSKEAKQKIQKMLLAELKKFEDGHFSVADPMEKLFNSNGELAKLIKSLKK